MEFCKNKNINFYYLILCFGNKLIKYIYENKGGLSVKIQLDIFFTEALLIFF